MGRVAYGWAKPLHAQGLHSRCAQVRWALVSAFPARCILFQPIETCPVLCRMTEFHVFARWCQRRTLIVGATLLVAALAGGVIYLRAHRAGAVVQVPFSDLLRDLDNGSVAAVVVNGDTLDFTLTSGRTLRTN